MNGEGDWDLQSKVAELFGLEQGSSILFIILAIFFSITLTWGIGVGIPAIFRYTLLKRPLRNCVAATVTIIWSFALLLFFIAMGSTSKTHAVILVMGFVTFRILVSNNRKEYNKQVNINRFPHGNNANIDISDTHHSKEINNISIAQSETAKSFSWKPLDYKRWRSLPFAWSGEDDGETWIWGEFYLLFQKEPLTITEVRKNKKKRIPDTIIVEYRYAMFAFICDPTNPISPSSIPVCVATLEQINMKAVNKARGHIEKEFYQMLTKSGPPPMLYGYFLEDKHVTLSEHNQPNTALNVKNNLFMILGEQLKLVGQPIPLGNVKAVLSNSRMDVSAGNISSKLISYTTSHKPLLVWGLLLIIICFVGAYTLFNLSLGIEQPSNSTAISPNTVKDGHRPFLYPNGTTYEGQWANGERNGQGVLTWPNGQTYSGKWENDKKNGYGTETLKDGTTYEGQWKDNLRHGKGTTTWPDGRTYEGMWENNQMSGQGVEILSDGTKYIGEWKLGEKNGKGTLYTKSGSIIAGSWQSDLFIGTPEKVISDDTTHEIVKYEDGSVYIGNLSNGKRNGYGTITWPTGDIYIGDWKSDVCNGYGTYQSSSGDLYVGQWNNHQTQGKGIQVWSTGETYIGEWHNGLRNGLGTVFSKSFPFYSGMWENDVLVKQTDPSVLIMSVSYEDGSTYEGEAINGNRNGLGVYAWPTGEQFAGLWEMDRQYGHGIYIWPTGEKYVGEWANGVREGIGISISLDGTATFGIWENDMLVK